MPEPDRFLIRFVPGLKEKLQIARDKRSLNKEINQRLEHSFTPDAASELAQAFRPFLDQLSTDDRARFVELAVAAIDILAKKQVKKRAKRGSESG